MRNSATYWVNTINILTSSLKNCHGHEKRDYKNAIRYAEKKLRAIRQRAGIY